jgi:hypothetical protein
MTVIPENEQLKRAVKWISEQLRKDENQRKAELINQATLRFDLSPKQAEFLINFYSGD